MATIVELGEMSNDKIEELWENAKEELFNLRFQKASARLENYARLQHVRREAARIETVLRMRELATATAVAHPEIAAGLAKVENWQATSRFVYEESAWKVTFANANGSEVATAWVDLNQKQSFTRAKRVAKSPVSLVTSYEMAG